MEELLCLLGVAVVVITTISQVMVPVLLRKPTFPLFRRETQLNKEELDLERRKKEAQKRLRIAEMEKEAVELELKAELARNAILEEQLQENDYETKPTQKR